jgi:hypothetical protein
MILFPSQAVSHGSLAQVLAGLQALQLVDKAQASTRCQEVFSDSNHYQHRMHKVSVVVNTGKVNLHTNVWIYILSDYLRHWMCSF